MARAGPQHERRQLRAPCGDAAGNSARIFLLPCGRVGARSAQGVSDSVRLAGRSRDAFAALIAATRSRNKARAGGDSPECSTRHPSLAAIDRQGNSMKVGDVVDMQGAYERLDANNIMLDPCLAHFGNEPG
jgi:hypothetical protein